MKIAKLICLCHVLTVFVLYLIFLSGCKGKETEESTVRHFECVFKDSKGIGVGDRVKSSSGAYIGEVEGDPELLIEGKEEFVVIPIKINKLSQNELKRLTSDIKIYVKKSMIDGINDPWIEVDLADADGVPLQNGTRLRGLDSWGPIHFPDTRKGILQWTLQRFGIGQIKNIGLIPFLFGWIGLFAIPLLGIVMVLDLLLRLPQGRAREKSSPRLFQFFWRVFIVVFFLKAVLLAIMLTGVICEFQIPSNFVTLPPALSSVLLDGCFFWLFTLILIVIRFKFELLVRVKSRSF